MFKSWVLNIRVDRCRLPDGRELPEYYTIETRPWVNVVALTEDNHLLLVRQYRYAKGCTSIEFPAGVCEDQDTEAAAKRELLEETGYVPGSIELIAEHYPNPALMSNSLFTYFATGCKRYSEQKLDPFEDIEILKAPVAKLSDYIKSGEFNHSLMLASLFLANDRLKELLGEAL